MWFASQSVPGSGERAEKVQAGRYPRLNPSRVGKKADKVTCVIHGTCAPLHANPTVLVSGQKRQKRQKQQKQQKRQKRQKRQEKGVRQGSEQHNPDRPVPMPMLMLMPVIHIVGIDFFKLQSGLLTEGTATTNDLLVP